MLVVFKFYFRRILKNWLYLLLLTLFPFVHMLVTYAQYSEQYKYRVELYAEENSTVVQSIIKNLNNSNIVVNQETVLDSGKKALMEKKGNLLITIQSGFEEDVIGNQSFEKIQVQSVMQDATTALLSLKFNSYLSVISTLAMNSAGDKMLFYEGLKDFQENALGWEENFEKAESKSIYAGLISVVSFDSLFVLIAFILLFLKDKENSVQTRIFASPVNRFQYYGELLLVTVFLGLVQFLLALIGLCTLLGMPLEPGMLASLFFMTLLYVISCGLVGQLINIFSKNVKVGAIIFPLLVIPLGMVSGQLWPREIMPEVTQWISSFTFTTWMVQFSDAVFVQNFSFDHIKGLYLNFLIFIAIASGIGIVKIKFTRRVYHAG